MAAPAAAGIGAALLVRLVLPRPTTTLQALLWFAVMTVAMLLVVLAVERAGRRLMPLAALLNLALLFPDQAPKRFAVARRVGRPRDLQRQLQEARERGVSEGGVVAYMQTILELVAALSVHDKQTRGHSERVRVFADLIADEMNLPAASRARLRWASLLHDIGKLLVPSEVLSKPSALNDAEWQRVRRHPEEGAQFIEPLRPWLGEWALAVEHHHERWDGRGYPRGLAGEEISLAGRIVGVADAYEVMTAVRPYRRPIGVVAAREELVRCSGKQFDPTVVRAFLNISVGRLWRVVGVSAWVGQLPLLAWLNGLGAQAGTAVVSGTTAVGLTVLGIPPTPSMLPSPSHHSAPVAAGTGAPGGPPSSSGAPGPSGSTSNPAASGHSQTGSSPDPAAGNGAAPTGSATAPPSAPGGGGRAPAPIPLPGPNPNPVPTSTPIPTPTPTPIPVPVSIPVVTMPAGASIAEGSTYTATGSFSDPGGTGWTALVDYGDGSGPKRLALAGPGFGLNHTYADPCSCVVTVTVANARTGTGRGSDTVTVANVPPNVSLPTSTLALLGAYNSSGIVIDSDYSADGLTATVDYGDGSGRHPLTLNGTQFTLSHSYGLLAVGSRTVTVTVTDNDGAPTTRTTTVNLV